MRSKLVAGFVCVLLAGGLLGSFVAAASAQEYNFVFITQWGPESAFSAVVEHGMKDAAKMLGCKMYNVSSSQRRRSGCTTCLI